MVTGLYSAMADSIPILCITGQAPRAKLHKEDFQAIDMPRSPGRSPNGRSRVMEARTGALAFRQAFQLMRSGRPGPVLIDLPLDVQKEMIEYDPESTSRWRSPSRARIARQIEKALDMMAEAKRPLIIAGGGVINAEASRSAGRARRARRNTPVVPTLMGWGSIPDDHPLNAGMVGLQTQHRYGNAKFLESDFVLGIGNRWANRKTGTIEVYTKGRKFVHVDIEPTQIGRVFCPDLGIVSDAKHALEQFVEVARERKAPAAPAPQRLGGGGPGAQAHHAAPDRLRQRADQAAARVPGDQRGFDDDTPFVTAIGLYQIASGQFQRINKPRNYIICGQAGPLGWEIPACIGAKLANPTRRWSASSATTRSSS